MGSDQLGLGAWAMAAAPTGDKLHRFYTPHRLALACVDHLRETGALSTEHRRLLEPSVGGGVFVRALRKRTQAHVTGVDLDPAAAGLALVDEAYVCRLLDFDPAGHDAAVGNPPFGGPHDDPAYLGARHARHLLEAGVGLVALVLPMWWVGVHEVDRLLLADYPPRVVRVRRRPWRTVREVALYVWDRARPPRFEVMPDWLDWR